MKMLDGKKTYLAGIGLILIGVGGFLISVTGFDSAHAMTLQESGMTVVSGLGLLGLGHKFQKLIDALKK